MIVIDFAYIIFTIIILCVVAIIFIITLPENKSKKSNYRIVRSMYYGQYVYDPQKRHFLRWKSLLKEREILTLEEAKERIEFDKNSCSKIIYLEY